MANNLLSCKYFDSKENLLTLDSFNDTLELSITSDLSFGIKAINSNTTLILRLQNDVSNIKYTMDIDNHSSLKEIMIINSSNDVTINKECNNSGSYTSYRIDLHEKSTLSTDVVNLEENASCSLTVGIYAKNDSKKNYQTTLNHYGSLSKADANLFAISDDNAHVSIYTDAFIKNGAHGCDSRQVGRIINMTENASGIVLPNLHIDENDVVASHSCSVGSVNKDHIYYLQTRGFSEKMARALLIKGYFNPLLKNINDPKIDDEVDNLLKGSVL